MAQFVYLRAERNARLYIEEGIHDALDLFCTQLGLADVPHWDLMPIVLLDMTAAAPASLKIDRAA